MATVNAIATYFASDYVAHLNDPNVECRRKPVREMLNLYQRAFPRFKVEVEIRLERSDRVS